MDYRWSTFNQDDFIDGDGFENITKKLGISYCEGRDINAIDNEYVLYHNGDACILPVGVDRRPLGEYRGYDLFWENIPEKLKLFFSQNVDVDDDRIVCLPIGLERRRWKNIFRVDKHERLFNMMNQNVEKSKLVYLNVNPITNRISRPKLIKAMNGKDWCTNEFHPNGFDYDNYLHQIKSHKFVFCPDGNGIDCHRTWEVLYVGSYPIVERHVFSERFAKNLPILVVDDWEDVTEELLHKKYDEFSNKSWNWDMLKMFYWEKFIEGKYNDTN